MVASESRELMKTCQRLVRESRVGEALALLRDPLRRGTLGAERSEVAGRFLQKAFAREDSPVEPLRVLLLGQCTVSWVGNALTAEAWGGGVAVAAREGGYDSVLQDITSLAERPDVVVLVPWHQRLLAPGTRAAEDRARDELAFWRQVWNALPAESRLVQVGYDWSAPGALGYQLGARLSGDVRAVRRTNELFREALPDGAFFVDLEQISGELGRLKFYDSRNYFWTKQPFTPRGVRELARHLWAGIRAVTTGPKKVLVVDLDNTLWGGVVGEVGPLGIELGESPAGEAYRSFQSLVKELGTRGVVLAACSKNNPADAREAFEKNREMVLSLADFAAFDASWDPKPVALERIAETLNLGLDSFVFFDDNPAEREHVLQSLPEVEVVDVPGDPADYGGALQRGLWFESANLTEADLHRVEHYRAERERREVASSANSLEDYLASLEMVAEPRPIDDGNLRRVVQLIGKTNQFNLTTRRHTSERVLEIIDATDAVGMTVRLRDRFGDYGVVSVVLGERDPTRERPTLRLDTWLMSCRVIGRTLEDFVMNCVAELACERGYELLLGEYLPTKKNAQVAELYSRFGFVARESGDADRREFFLDLASFEPRNTFVSRVGELPRAP